MKKLLIILLFSIFFACSKEDTKVILNPINGIWTTYGHILQNRDTGYFIMYLDVKKMNLGYNYIEKSEGDTEYSYINIPINKITSDSIFIQITDTVFKNKSYYYKLENDSLNLPDLLFKKLRRVS